MAMGFDSPTFHPINTMAKPSKRRVVPAARIHSATKLPKKSVLPAAIPSVPVPAAAVVQTDSPRYGAAQRWTQDLVKDGFTPVSDYFLKNYALLQPPITTGEAMFVIHLMSFKWTSKAPHPSMRRIAERMGVSEVSARGYARNLEIKHYLQRVMRVGRTNHFRLRPLFSVLEAHMLANQAPTNDSDEIDD